MFVLITVTFFFISIINSVDCATSEQECAVRNASCSYCIEESSCSWCEPTESCLYYKIIPKGCRKAQWFMYRCRILANYCHTMCWNISDNIFDLLLLVLLLSRKQSKNRGKDPVKGN